MDTKFFFSKSKHKHICPAQQVEITNETTHEPAQNMSDIDDVVVIFLNTLFIGQEMKKTNRLKHCSTNNQIWSYIYGNA